MANNAISILINAKDNASRTLRQVSDEVRTAGNSADEAAPKTSRFNSSLSGTAAMVKGVAVAFAVYEIGHLISEMATGAVGAAAQLEQTNIALQSMTGNVKVANSVFGQLVQYANKTPFESKDIVQAAQTLMGFGTAGQQTVGIIKQLGDVVSVGGGDLKQLSLVTGQVFAQGKLRAQDMYQVINDGGAGVIKIMAKNAGGMKNLTAEFDKGGIPAKQYFDAIKEATTKGGFAFQGANKEANTFNGKLSTLKDSATQFGMALLGVKIDPQLGYVVQKGGLFDRMKNAIGDIATALQGWGPATSKVLPKLFSDLQRMWSVLATYLGPSFQALWKTISTQLMPALSNFWHKVVEPLIPVIGTLLVGAIYDNVNTLNLLLKTVTPVMNFLSGHTWVIYGLITAFGILKGAMMLDAAFTALKKGFALLTTSIIPQAAVKVTAFRALVSSNMIMGSIAVAGALADIALVSKAIGTVRQAISDLNDAKKSAENYESAKASTHATLLNLVAHGDAGQKARAKKLLAQGYASGGFTGRGGANEVAGVVHKGEYVLPKSQVNQSTGQPKAGGDTYITISGTINIETPQAANAFWDRIDKTQRLAAVGMA